ncbi:MAG: 1,4-alpha-glucan branching protein GlgB [Pirellulales bacterium]
MRTAVSLSELGSLLEGRHENPFQLLGPHQVEHEGTRRVAVRAFLPQSTQAWLVDEQHQQSVPMRRIHPSGLYEAIHPMTNPDKPKYRIRHQDQRGQTVTMHDPYAFSSTLTDFDLHLLGEGRHWDSYERLGAHPRTIDGVEGVSFCVWAPNATGISVVGDFNDWDARRHPMRKLIPSGFWELFVPGVAAGTRYKYRVNRGGHLVDKCDPYGFAAEVPPLTASVVADLNQYSWQDAEWLERRRDFRCWERPVSVYEVHLGSWRRTSSDVDAWLDYRALAHELVAYCHQQGYTHLELLPVSEHPFTGSWGYQTVGYYAVTSRYGKPEDFMYFVDYCHRNGIGVILDWVPAHFPRDDHGLRQFDGTALYEHADPRQGEHPDWGTLIFNYGRNEVRNFLVSNALFWLDKYHIDGLRVDAVASMLYLDYSRSEGQWIPNKYGGRENLEAIEFLKEFNTEVHSRYPGVMTIAEESTAWPGVSRPVHHGGLGFSVKWNMGWMNDTLSYMRHDPIHRRFHHDELTFSLIYAFTENFSLPLSHDEVVHGKGSLLDQMPGDLWQKFANLRLLYAYMWTHPGKKLLFMGSDFGQWHEWNHNESLQWHLLQWESHQGIQKLIADLNRVYQQQPALYDLDFDGAGFEWIDCHSREDSVLAYLRKGKSADEQVLACCNFTPVPRLTHRVGVPGPGWYEELLNTDSAYYGGSNVGNLLGAVAEPIPWHGREWSISIQLPPLGLAVFKRHPQGK